MVKDIDQFINNLTAEFNSKQRKVVFERFGLKTGVKATLQEIGNDLGVTRERVRQIEEDGLRKLGPKVKKEAVQIVEFAHTYLANAGGVRRDDYFLTDVANYLFKETDAKHVDAKLRFLFLTAGAPFYSREDDDFNAYWYVDEPAKKKFLDFVKEATDFLKSRKEAETSKDYLSRVKAYAASSLFMIPKHFGTNIFGDVGLRSWPDIEPKTIRDKIYLVLKKHGEPLHFSDIARNITKLGIDRKQAHVQTVHNELIKDDRFVLVGRGIYALRSRGFEPGTVRQVIAKILKTKGPLPQTDVVRLVNEQRFLKENTVLLSLQNRRHFKRLDDGRYHVKEA
ncbi:MAG: RNA polymerase sigma factor [Candidatus Jorgensenbacteria bacterium GW2011_GWA1_48_11]|uniref:RNA polymerase sigma factor n=1 Tax=Candidatus Jorgensenbacteria bacterium GW2011_GWA1_48_11 TaxID=1618660 RepID=A0A0G1X9D4_9BACT|nr:MAG: RNA polymerase sigma factor [Candidatus Jorgensenbacteria bacterium GW2011_GWA1_48_11]KKW12304.1 MAG: RNA polymerase sigma factor [Candidatus Jorgensenbacteria bacterium GW2011_GWB1_49_9]